LEIVSFSSWTTGPQWIPAGIKWHCCT